MHWKKYWWVYDTWYKYLDIYLRLWSILYKEITFWDKEIVVFQDRWPIHMKFSMTGQEKGNLSCSILYSKDHDTFLSLTNQRSWFEVRRLQHHMKTLSYKLRRLSICSFDQISFQVFINKKSQSNIDVLPTLTWY
jgi:hypothetical protein